MFSEFEIPETWQRLLKGITRSVQEATIVGTNISEYRYFDVVVEMSRRERLP
jgi:hypothetical protein